MAEEEKSVNRRRFFREGFRELLKPLSQIFEPLEEAARQLERMDQLANTQARERPALRPPMRRVPLNIVLRPPGSLEERSFRDTCSRCGECVRVCPAQCIKIDATGVRGNGAPYIDADVMPCVVCEGLQCMHVCPTGALAPIPLVDIDMGLAVWHSDTCIRSDGEPCTICVDRCPVGTFAIEVIDNAIEVHEKGCIGCGVCQHDCPTSPKSIVVIPRAANTAGASAR